MPQFPANIDLSSLDGTTGFKISGAAGEHTGSSVASHLTRRLTVAGITFCPPNVKVSMTGASSAWSLARRPSRLIRNASSSTSTVQKSPDGGMPPLKSWTCAPEPGSKRSTQMNANVPKRRVPSVAT